MGTSQLINCGFLLELNSIATLQSEWEAGIVREECSCEAGENTSDCKRMSFIYKDGG